MMVAPGDLANQRLIAKSKRRIEGNQVFQKGPQDGPRINVTRVNPEREMLASRENDILRGQNADEQQVQKLRYPNLKYRSQTYKQPAPQQNQDLFEGIKTEPVSYQSPQRTGQIFRGQNYDNGIPEPLKPAVRGKPPRRSDGHRVSSAATWLGRPGRLCL